MNTELIETVESLGGTASMGGILIQFSDTTFIEAFKKIYEAGAEAEREACAKIVESHGPTLANGLMLTEAIRARGQA